jgi:hypothetical protein
MTDGSDALDVMLKVAGHRNWWQAFRGARHRGDFQGMVYAEVNATLWADAIIDYTPTLREPEKIPCESVLPRF